MVIAISYNKQTWNEYNDSQTADENSANGAIISADRLNHMEDGIGNNDINKVTDNKNGTIEVNGSSIIPADDSKVATLQTQVNNSAVGTNLLIGTSPLEKSYTGDFSTVPGWSNNTGSINPCAVNVGSTYTYSIDLTKVTGSFIVGYWGYDSNKNYLTWTYGGGYSSSGKVSWTFTVPSGISYIFPHVVHLSNDFACTAKGEKLELGSHATDWCPNPDDKVNVADMRKPASDVAGIEEVNAKQDKLTITPADDSKVAHLSGANDFDTVPTVKNNPLLLASSLPADLARTGADNNFKGANSFDQDPVDKDGIAYRSGGPNLAPGTSDDWQTFSGENWVTTDTSGKITGLESGNTYTFTAEYRNNTVPIRMELYGYDKNNAQIITDYVPSAPVVANSSGKLTFTFTNTFSDSAYFILDIAATTTQTATQSYEYRRVKLEKGSTSTPWEPSNYDILTRVIDNHDGSIIVNGATFIPADDSKVAHLSGANNFDTTPTYGTNNKPFAINDTGATTARPTGQAVGYQYFDTTLNKPIWYNGTNWVDSTGTTV